MDNKKKRLQLLNDLNYAIDRAADKIRTLEAQIEKMKNCVNCRYIADCKMDNIVEVCDDWEMQQ